MTHMTSQPPQRWLRTVFEGRESGRAREIRLNRILAFTKVCVTERLSEGGSLIVEVDVFLGEHVSLFLQEVCALVFLLAEFVSGGRVPTEAGMSTVVRKWCYQECRDALDTVIEVGGAESGIRAAVDSSTASAASTRATQGTASCRACWTVACTGTISIIGFAAVAAATFPLSTVVFELVVVVVGTCAPTESTLVVEEVYLFGGNTFFDITSYVRVNFQLIQTIINQQLILAAKS